MSNTNEFDVFADSIAQPRTTKMSNLVPSGEPNAEMQVPSELGRSQDGAMMPRMSERGRRQEPDRLSCLDMMPTNAQDTMDMEKLM